MTAVARLAPVDRYQAVPYRSRCVCARERLAARRAERLRGPADRHDRDRDDVLGQREQRAELGRERRRDRRERAAEAERGRGEQQVLHRGEDRRRHGLPRGPRSMSAHTTIVHRRGRDSAGRARVDVGQQLRRRAGSRRTRGRPTPTRVAVRSPIAARVVASRTTTNSHGWRFSALGAWVAASSTLRDRASSPTGIVGERAARALAVDDREEVVVVGHPRVRSPTRANVLTYMMRRLGPNAQCLNASVSGAADAFHHERRHRLERRLGVVGVHLVEVHEARIAAGRVLVRRDHRVARAPRPRRCGGCARSRPSRAAPARGPAPWARSARARGRCVGRPVTHALAGPAVVAEVVAGDAGAASSAAAKPASTS